MSLACTGLFRSLPLTHSGHLVTEIAPEAPRLFKKKNQSSLLGDLVISVAQGSVLVISLICIE